MRPVAWDNIIVLPMHQLLTDAQLRRIIEIVGGVHGATSATKPRSDVEPRVVPAELMSPQGRTDILSRRTDERRGRKEVSHGH